MATGDDDNNVDGNGATGSEADDDGDDDDGDVDDDVDGRRQRRPKTTTMATARRATRSKMMATARRATGDGAMRLTMMTAQRATKLTTGKTKVIGQGTAPVLVPMTLVFFGLFSHTLTIKATLDNTLVDIMPSLVLL